MTNRAAHKALKVALTDLICTEPFWAYLALRLSLVEDSSQPTAWTDGTSMGYNPEFVLSLTQPQLRGLIAHEVCHCALGHPWRREHREPGRWNRAADYAINDILTRAKFALPEGGLLDAQYRGLSSEAIYGRLQAEEASDPSSSSIGISPTPPAPTSSLPSPSPSPEAFGEVRDAPSATEEVPALTEDDWSNAVLQAQALAGKEPGGMERAVTEARQPRCRSLLDAMLAWAERRAMADYSWSRPSSRYAHLGLYLPRLQSPSMPPIVAIVDTSGSIDAEQLAQFEGALQRVLDELSPESMVVISADARVQRTDVYEPGAEIAGKYPGGGGTNFAPALKEAMTHSPAGIVYLTDLDGPFPDVAPEVPVLWVVNDPKAERRRTPFGETVYV